MGHLHDCRARCLPCFPSCPLAILLLASASEVSSKIHPSAYSRSTWIKMTLIFPYAQGWNGSLDLKSTSCLSCSCSDGIGPMKNQLQETCYSCWWSSAPSGVVGKMSVWSSGFLRRARLSTEPSQSNVTEIWTETWIPHTTAGGPGCSYSKCHYLCTFTHTDY